MNRISQIHHDSVKNPNWPEVNQLVIYKIKSGRGVEFLLPGNISSRRGACKLCAQTARPARKNSHSISKMENNELVETNFNKFLSILQCYENKF